MKKLIEDIMTVCTLLAMGTAIIMWGSIGQALAGVPRGLTGGLAALHWMRDSHVVRRRKCQLFRKSKQQTIWVASS